MNGLGIVAMVCNRGFPIVYA